MPTSPDYSRLWGLKVALTAEESLWARVQASAGSRKGHKAYDAHASFQLSYKDTPGLAALRAWVQETLCTPLRSDVVQQIVFRLARQTGRPADQVEELTLVEAVNLLRQEAARQWRTEEQDRAIHARVMKEPDTPLRLIGKPFRIGESAVRKALARCVEHGLETVTRTRGRKFAPKSGRKRAN